MKMADIKGLLRQYFKTYLKREISQDLRDDTPLLSSGIIDSIGVVGLVDFIESKFNFEFTPGELDLDSLETMDRIHEVVKHKLATKGAP